METFSSGGVQVRIAHAEPPGAGPHPAVLLLHGSGGAASYWMDRVGAALVQAGVASYGVHYFDRTGTSRADAATILDGKHFPLWVATVRDALSYISARPGVDPRRIAVLGVSLGGFLAMAVAIEDPRVAATVEISGGVPREWAARATARLAPTLVLHGETDTIVSVQEARELDSLLDRLGVPHKTRIFPGEGHWFSPAAYLPMLATIAAFLSQHLRVKKGVVAR